jgi:hypothetical protein
MRRHWHSAIVGCFGGEIRLAENAIQSHLLLRQGAWLTYSFRFRHTPCLPRPGFRGLSTTDMGSGQRRYCNKIGN